MASNPIITTSLFREKFPSFDGAAAATRVMPAPNQWHHRQQHEAGL
jgi:hypothetical protein